MTNVYQIKRLSFVIFCFFLSSCSKDYISNDIKIVNLHGDNKAILVRKDGKNFDDFLVQDNVTLHCKIGNSVFGFREIPDNIKNSDSIFHDEIEYYKNNTGAFKINIKEKKVYFESEKTKNDIHDICER